LLLVPSLRFTGAQLGKYRSSAGMGSALKQMLRPTKPTGAVLVKVLSPEFHRNTRSASAQLAKTSGSDGCVATCEQNNDISRIAHTYGIQIGNYNKLTAYRSAV
jgi:hypothetical protein